MKKPIEPIAQFMFREKEIARLLRVWARGQSVLIVGIRRTGKTQLMKAALKRQASMGAVVYFDVQETNSLYDFYDTLLAALPKPLIAQLQSALQTLGSVPTGIVQWVGHRVGKVTVSVTEAKLSLDLNAPENLPRYWPNLLTALVEVVQAKASDELPVIGIDELPMMLENLQKAGVPMTDLHLLLSGLRKLREAGLRMVIGGSISTENLLTALNIPHAVLGGLWREEVKPFTAAQARTYLEVQLQGTAALATIDAVLTALPDYVPEFLRIAATYLADLDDATDTAWSLSHQVMPSIHRMFLEQFNERLAQHFVGAQLDCAQGLLDQIAQHPLGGGRIDSTALPSDWRLVLNKLMFDNFVHAAPDLGYAFTLNMLRQWWRAQRGMP